MTGMKEFSEDDIDFKNQEISFSKLVSSPDRSPGHTHRKTRMCFLKKWNNRMSCYNCCDPLHTVEKGDSEGKKGEERPAYWGRNDIKYFGIFHLFSANSPC